MDRDDRADIFAIVGLAGAGAALMLVGSLDLTGAAIVVAVLGPSLLAILAAGVTAIVAWYQGQPKAHANRSDARQRYQPARHEQTSSVLRAARESHKESL